MPAGLQIFDAAGKAVLDTTTFMGLAIGSVNTGAANGSLTDSRLAEGDPFFFLSPLEFSATTVLPVVTVSGSKLSWTYPTTRTKASCQIVYGIK